MDISCDHAMQAHVFSLTGALWHEIDVEKRVLDKFLAEQRMSENSK